MSVGSTFQFDGVSLSTSQHLRSACAYSASTSNFSTFVTMKHHDVGAYKASQGQRPDTGAVARIEGHAFLRFLTFPFKWT